MSSLHSTMHPVLETSSDSSSPSIQPSASEQFTISVSDGELSDIPLEKDLDYHESLNTITVDRPIPSVPANTSHVQPYTIRLPPPPARPAHFRCNPAWHFDEPRSPINSDGEEVDFSEDSEDGVIAESSKTGKKQKKKKRKSCASMQRRKDRQQDWKKARTSEVVKEAKKYRAGEGANIYALIRRQRGHQPSDHFERPIQEIYKGYKTFTLDQVKHGIIIRDSGQRVLVHLFPPQTISSALIPTLATSLQKYENSVSFPNYDYTRTRGDYQVHILGCWFKSGRFLQPYMTAHYRGPHSGIHYKRLDNPYYMAAKKFQRANRSLFQVVEDLIRQHHPDIWEVYRNIKVPSGCNKFAGLFAAVVSNKLVQTKVHKDLGDIKGGICIVIC